MATPAQTEALLRRMRQMSAGDLSMLEAAVNTPDSNMATGPGSPNEALWSEMAALGWIVTRDEELDIPGGIRFPMRIYSITPEGRQPIAGLLSILAGRQGS
jgi:hypothetical protein